jgi:toxin-antitoxin system PIN domain toxin
VALYLDINVLVYGFRKDSVRHAEYESWLAGVARTDEAIGIPELALVGLVRIVTNPKIYRLPSTSDEAFSFLAAFERQANAFVALPGPTHRQVFRSLCSAVPGGNDVTDAYLAALAIEADAEFITTDRGFARFPGLRWRHPLDG